MFSFRCARLGRRVASVAWSLSLFVFGVVGGFALIVLYMYATPRSYTALGYLFTAPVSVMFLPATPLGYCQPHKNTIIYNKYAGCLRRIFRQLCRFGV